MRNCRIAQERTFVTHFTDLNLHEVLLRAVKAEGYETPTPIQAQAIPALMMGQDVLGLAQTGTGKTAAFVLPLLHRLHGDKRSQKPKSVRALILAPTRELAAQIAESVRTYGRYTHVSHGLVVGGASARAQIRTLEKGLDILVATPGRLLDHMGAGAVRLDHVETVVLDEADQMFDMGFMPAIRRIMARLPKARQTLLFSATMPKPIRDLANEFLRSPVEIAVAPTAKPIEKIAQSIIPVSADAKRGALIEILKKQEVKRAIVFTRTKRGADKVSKALDAAALSAGVIHGDKSQPQRDRALASFRAGHTRILVATDVAARGIDIDGITHVINFELPNVPEIYVHRIGRTARAGADGIAISLCDSSERGLLRDIERLIGKKFDVNFTGMHHDAPSKPETRNRPHGAARKHGAPHRERKFSPHRNSNRPLHKSPPKQPRAVAVG
jgi:ATP-dependent RNA helicase RhlE